MRNCGLDGQTIKLMAQEPGYQSCPMDGFDYDAVANIINLLQDHAIAFMIAIGKGTREAWPHLFHRAGNQRLSLATRPWPLHTALN